MNIESKFLDQKKYSVWKGCAKANECDMPAQPVDCAENEKIDCKVCEDADNCNGVGPQKERGAIIHMCMAGVRNRPFKFLNFCFKQQQKINELIILKLKIIIKSLNIMYNELLDCCISNFRFLNF